MPAITTGPVPIPADVVDYVYKTFEATNDAVSGRLDRMPTTHEESLDFAFIDSLLLAAGPHITPSGVVIDIDVHFAGGGWHVDRWEIADIGMILTFRRSRTVIRTKVLLLQSKRLYPVQADFVEFRGLARLGGFGSLAAEPWLPAQETRTFTFNGDCRYKALQVGDTQWAKIKSYEEQYSIPVHYLLYHPSDMPYEREIPTILPLAPQEGPARVGARVISAQQLRAAVHDSPRNHAPSYMELGAGHPEAAPGMRLQEFVRDRVLTCEEGYIASRGSADAGLNLIFNRRSGPIAAAIRIDIDVPEELDPEVLEDETPEVEPNPWETELPF